MEDFTVKIYLVYLRDELLNQEQSSGSVKRPSLEQRR